VEIRASSTAFSGSYVGNINVPEAFVEFTGVWRDEDGSTEVRAYYANSGNAAVNMTLSVNNVQEEVVTFPVTSGSEGTFNPQDFVTLQLSLLRGINALIFKSPSGSISLDRIYVSPSL
jgi:hypothetical protein